MLILTAEGIYAARDRLGRTPLVIGAKDSGFCVTFESFAYFNLGYRDYKELGPGEIDMITPEKVEIRIPYAPVRTDGIRIPQLPVRSITVQEYPEVPETPDFSVEISDILEAVKGEI